MTKFVKVDSPPEKLGKKEFVIPAPSFIDEIKLSMRKAPKNKLMTSNFLKEIAAKIGDKYMGPDFSTLTDINTSLFRGIPFESLDDIDKVVQDMFLKSAPAVFDNFVDYHLKSRPYGIQLIYFLGDFSQTAAFTRNGIDEIKLKDVDVELGRKPKKTVGKPAVKDKKTV
jgi:hypothetical protein